MKIKITLLASFIAIAILASLMPFILQNNLDKRLAGLTIIDKEKIPETSQSYYIIFTLTSIAIGIILALLISNSILKPISNIKEQIHRLERGDKTKPVDIKGNNEISELAKSFNTILHIQNKQSKDYSNIQKELHIIKKIKDIEDS